MDKPELLEDIKKLFPEINQTHIRWSIEKELYNRYINDLSLYLASVNSTDLGMMLDYLNQPVPSLEEVNFRRVEREIK